MPAHTLEYVDILPPLGFIRELHADAAYAPERWIQTGVERKEVYREVFFFFPFECMQNVTYR